MQYAIYSVQLTVCNIRCAIYSVDEKGEYQLSNFYGKHHKGRVTESDHAMIQLQMNLKFIAQKPQRTEAFNFLNAESSYFFKDITTDTSEFSNCFLSKETF